VVSGRDPAERLAEAEARIAELEYDREWLLGVVEGLVGAVELLAEAVGARPREVAPARPALRVIQGGGGS
jgi:hypothetical protein